MTIKIEITCDNAAFQDNPLTEAGRILRRLGSYLYDQDYDKTMPVDPIRLRDINGNHVGTCTVSD